LTAGTISGASYSWTGPNGFVSSSQNPSIIGVVVNNFGTYSVTATLSGCTSTAGTTTVTVNTPPSTPTAGSNGTICSGQTLSFTASTIPGATYSWTGPNGFVSSSQNPSIANASTLASGTYSVEATLGGCPSSTPGTTNVTVIQSPSAPVSANVAACFGNTIPNLTASGTNVNWYSDPSLLTLVHSGSTFATGKTAAGIYTYYVTQSNGSCPSPYTMVTLTISLPPTLPISSSYTICSASIAPNLTASGSYVKWYSDAGLTQFVFIGNSFATGKINAGVYTYYVADSTIGCPLGPSEKVSLTINALPNTPVVNDTAICFGNLPLNLAFNGMNVQWYNASMTIVNSGNTFSTGLSTVGTYTFYVSQTNANTGCESLIDTVIALVKPSPIKPLFNDTSVCYGNVAVLTASGNDPQWFGDPTLINLLGTGNKFNTHLTEVGKYNYYVEDYATGCGYSIADTVSISINPIPLVTANTYTVNISLGDSVDLIAYNAVTYKWYPPAGLNNTNKSKVVASPLVTTSYTVTGTNAYGCSSDKTILVIVNGLGINNLLNMPKDLKVYPNPAIEQFILEFSIDYETSINIYVIDMLGQHVGVTNIVGVNGPGFARHKYEIDAKNLAEGVYQIEIITNQGRASQKLVIIK